MTRMPQANVHPMPTEKAQLVRYIRDMGRELAKMANGASLDLLAYLLSLVVLEADSLNASELAARSENSSLQD